LIHVRLTSKWWRSVLAAYSQLVRSPGIECIDQTVAAE